MINRTPGMLALLALTACDASGNGGNRASETNSQTSNSSQAVTASVANTEAAPASSNVTATIDTAADEAAISAVINKLYAGYNTPDGPDFALSPAFDSAWKRAVGKDGAMDADPFCQCQDFDKVRVTEQRITISGDTARDTVTFLNFGNKTKTVLGLVRVGKRWMIDDIIDEKGRGMKASMLDSKPGSWSIDAQ